MKKLIYILMFMLSCDISYATTEISTAGTNLGIGTTSIQNALSIKSTAVIGSATYTSTTAPSNGLLVEGNVGLGSLAPGTKLDVSGTVRATTFSGSAASLTSIPAANISGVIPIANLATGTPDGTKFIRDDGTLITPAGVSQWTTIGSDIYYNTGNIGVGTSSAGQHITVLQAANNVNAGIAIANAASTGSIKMWHDGTNGRISTGTTDADNIYILGAGVANVGIGTTTTAVKLTVSGAPATNSSVGFKIENRTGGNWTLGALGTASATAPSAFSLFDGSSFRMLINNSGNVGFGTTAPRSLLEVGTGKLNVLSGGNVGVGSSTPGTTLDVQGTTRTTGLQLNLAPLAGGNVLVSDSVGVGTWMPPSTLPGGAGGSGTVNSGIATFYGRYPSTGTTIDDSAVTMDDGTNVGIGTVSPKALLNINSSAAQDLFRVDDSAGSDATPFIIDQTGNVGVGSANPSAVLAVSSTVSQTLFRVDDNGTGDLSPFIIDANGNVGIGTTNTERDALLVMSGNVGIGTWVPTTALDVKGTTVTTGFQLNLAPLTGGNVLVSNSVGVGTWMPSTTLNVTATASPGGGLNAVQYSNGSSITGNEAVFSMNGTNVGIGTTNGINNKLDIRGDATVVGNIGIGTSLTTTAALSVLGGNVGVGTWVPAGLFNVNLNGLAATSTDGIILSNNTITTSGATAQLNPRVRQRGHYWSGSVDQTIDWKQEVTTGTGVGSQIFSYSDNGGAYNTVLTMTKSSNATFAGVLQGASLIAASGGNATVPITVTAPTGMTGNMQTWARNLAPLSMMNNNGNMGIGTLMAENRLSIQGPIGVGTGYNSPFLSTVGPSGGMIIEGNVGIGTMTPQAKFIVLNGNVGIGTWTAAAPLEVRGATVGSVKSASNTACTTTCGASACLLGEDTSVVGTIVACSDATADICVCLGP